MKNQKTLKKFKREKRSPKSEEDSHPNNRNQATLVPKEVQSKISQKFNLKLASSSLKNKRNLKYKNLPQLKKKPKESKGKVLGNRQLFILTWRIK